MNLNQLIESCSNEINVGGLETAKLLRLLGTRGAALGRTGRTIEAIADFERAILLDPDDPLQYSNIATAYLKVEQFNDVRIIPFCAIMSVITPLLAGGIRCNYEHMYG
jgi:tetratricopeptide (TPR) repeat protein